jgi:hypothetical protein
MYECGFEPSEDVEHMKLLRRIFDSAMFVNCDLFCGDNFVLGS